MLILILLALLILSFIALLVDPSIVFLVFFGNFCTLLLIYKILKDNKLVEKKYFVTVAYYLIIISLFALLSYNDSIRNNIFSTPYIPGGDGELYFKLAKELYLVNPIAELNEYSINYLGYPILLAFLFKLFGVNLFAGLFINYSIIVISIVLMVSISKIVTNNKDIAFYTLIAGIITTPFISMGVMLLKDAMFVFGFALFTYSMISINSKKGGIFFHILLATIAFLIIGINRLPFILIIPIIVLICVKKINIRSVSVYIILSALLIVSIPLLTTFTSYTFDVTFIQNTTIANQAVEKHLIDEGIVSSLISGYTNWPLYYRIMMLPIPLMIQFVTPFQFWSSLFINDHFYYFTTQQLNVVWILITGPLLVISLIFFRLIKYQVLINLFYLGVVIYISIAFIYGGAIPRYAIPSLIFMLPSFGIIIYNFKHNVAFRVKAKKIYLSYYSVGLVLFITYLLRN